MKEIYIIMLIYFIIIFITTWYFGKKESLKDYFLNNKSSNLFLLIFSNTASLLGAGAIISIAAATYDSGISYGISMLCSLLCGMVILGIIAKKIVKTGNTYTVYSIVDFFQKRFDKKNTTLVFYIQLTLIIIWTAVQIIGINYLINTLTGINYYLALCISVGIVIIYTTFGGLKLDIITDFIQFIITSLVLIVITIFGYHYVGGIPNLITHLPLGHLNIFSFGGIPFFIGVILFGGLVYTGNTSHRQRILSAKDEKTAGRSFIYSIPLIIGVVGMIMFLGLIGAATITGINKDTVIFLVIKKIIHNKWLIGAGFACMLTAIMSSLNSLFIAGSTIMYKSYISGKNLTEKNGLKYARFTTAGFGIVCLIIALTTPNIIGLTLFCSYLTLTIIPALLRGLFSQKTSANASFYSILIGIIILCIGFPILGNNIFIISTLGGIITIFLYDKIFKGGSHTSKEIKNDNREISI